MKFWVLLVASFWGSGCLGDAYRTEKGSGLASVKPNSAQDSLEESCVGGFSEGLSEAEMVLESMEVWAKQGSSWGEYLEALKQKGVARKVMAAGAVGAATAGLVVGGWFGVGEVLKRQKYGELISREEMKISLEQKAMAEVHKERIKLRQSWLDLFGHVGVEEAEQSLEVMREPLRSRGYSTTELPAPLISLEDQKLLRDRGYLVSDEFFELSSHHVGSLLAEKGSTLREALQKPYVFEDQIGWSGLVDSFLDQGYRAHEIIDQRFLEAFFEFNRLSHEFFSWRGSVQSVSDFAEAIRLEPEQVLGEMNLFVQSEGLPDVAKYYMDQLTRATEVFEGGRAHELSEASRSQLSKAYKRVVRSKKRVGRLEGILAQNSQNLKVWGKKAVGVFLGFGALVVVVFKERGSVERGSIDREKGSIDRERGSIDRERGSIDRDRGRASTSSKLQITCESRATLTRSSF